MKSFRQVLRQPIKFFAGLILMTVAAAIVCVCVGQALAAQNTAKELDEQFTTVALARGDRDIHVPEDVETWLKGLAQSYPETVKTVAEHGLLSANIPELTPLNYTQGGFIAECFYGGNHTFYRYDPENDGRPYSSAMLVFTLEEVSEPVELIVDRRFKMDIAMTIKEFNPQELFFNWLEELGNDASIGGCTVTLSGTVTEVVSLQEGFRDPTGMTARLKLSLTTEEAAALDLDVGQSYLVYGMDYYDEDWALRSRLADERSYNIQIDAFDPRSLYYYYTEEELKSPNLPYSEIVGNYTCTIKSAQHTADGKPETVVIHLTAADATRINAVSMTLWENFHYINTEFYKDGYLNSPYVDRRENVTYTGKNGEEITMSWKEYTERYQIPTITRLEGSVEDFLQSEEGTAWREALEREKVNHHAFAVLGVDKAMYLGWFAQEEASITQGRDITEEEAESGAKVCIIHEEVALASGLEIGDTVTLNLYRGDNGLPYQGLRDNTGDLLMPSADFYFTTTPILETAEYTVVGLWKGPDTWPDIALNEYSLSPNTVIVPKSSVQTDWEHPNSVLYTNAILNNGKMEEFQNLARKDGFYNNNYFVCFDQGYTDLVGNFHDYEMRAQQMLIVGIVVYAVILLLFLLLYPTAQRKAVGTMESLGAPRGKRFAHVMLSSFIVVGPATVLGGAIGMALWQSVVDALRSFTQTTYALQLEVSTLLLIALAQFTFAMMLTAIIAICVTTPRNLSNRRRK